MIMNETFDISPDRKPQSGNWKSNKRLIITIAFSVIVLFSIVLLVILLTTNTDNTIKPVTSFNPANTTSNGYSALCITGATRTFPLIMNHIHDKIIRPLAKGKEGIDVYIISSKIDPDFDIDNIKHAWVDVNVTFQQFTPVFTPGRKPGDAHQYYNWNLCQKSINDSGKSYELVGKTRTDSLPCNGEDLGLDLIQNGSIVISRPWPEPSSWGSKLANAGDFAAFGTEQDMKVYFNTLQFFQANKSSSSMPLWPDLPQDDRFAEYYLINNLLDNGINFKKRVKFDKISSARHPLIV